MVAALLELGFRLNLIAALLALVAAAITTQAAVILGEDLLDSAEIVAEHAAEGGFYG